MSLRNFVKEMINEIGEPDFREIYKPGTSNVAPYCLKGVDDYMKKVRKYLADFAEDDPDYEELLVNVVDDLGKVLWDVQNYDKPIPELILFNQCNEDEVVPPRATFDWLVSEYTESAFFGFDEEYKSLCWQDYRQKAA